MEKNPTYLTFLLAFALAIFVSFSAHSASFAIFNDAGSESSDMSAFSKWTRVVADGQDASASDWSILLEKAANSKNIDMLNKINQQVNSYRYIEDQDNWKSQDYWETPQQFFTKGGGDCEDYAIVKYMALRALGWNPHDMRIVVLQDTKLNQLHSVLAVKLKNQVYILDNQSKKLMAERNLKHYVPIYSINESAWWRYGSTHKA